MLPGNLKMASRLKEQQSPVKRKFTSPLGHQKYVTKGISPRYKANLREFRSTGTGKQGKQKGDLGPGQARPWRKPQDKGRTKIVRFHCGGNSADPLNLNSLIDRDPSVTTPQASPLSEHSESPVQVLEPRDKTDPLNLKGVVLEPEIKDPHVAVKKRKKKKRHNVNHSNSENEGKPKEQLSTQSSDNADTVSEGKRKRKRNTNETGEAIEAKVDAKRSGKCTTVSAESKGHASLLTEDSEPAAKKTAGVIISDSSKEAESKSDIVKTDDSTLQGENENNSSLKAKDIGKFHRLNEGKHPKRDKHCQDGKPFKQKKLFIYGNYNRYYGYRNPHCSQDLRLKCLKKEWLEGKDVLDLGCNVGHVTLTIARDFSPRIIMGIDIDTGLIKAAKNNLRYYVNSPVSVPGTSEQGVDFPLSFSITSGPLAAPVVLDLEKDAGFPHNVVFKQENYVPDSSEVLLKQKPMYDVILCLSLTKWIHLNWGDEGLKLMFKRIFLHLRPGGKLILEPQPFSSYKKKKNLTEKIRANYDAMRFRPEHFVDFLLSDLVGFATFEVLEIPQHKSSGFQRPMYLFTKPPGVQEAQSMEFP